MFDELVKIIIVTVKFLAVLPGECVANRCKYIPQSSQVPVSIIKDNQHFFVFNKVRLIELYNRTF